MVKKDTKRTYILFVYLFPNRSFTSTTRFSVELGLKKNISGQINTSNLKKFNKINFDYVIHCAGKVGGLGGNMNYKGEYFYDNINGRK